MKHIGNLVLRLTSRKFLLTIGAVCIMLAAERYSEAVAVIIAFIGAEGAGDAVSRYAEAKATASAPTVLNDFDTITDDDDEMTDVIVSGRQQLGGEAPL